MPDLAHPEGHTDRYQCILVADRRVGRIGGALSSLRLVYIAVERYFAIIYSLRQRGRFTERCLKPIRRYNCYKSGLSHSYLISVTFLSCYHTTLHYIETDGTIIYTSYTSEARYHNNDCSQSLGL